MLEKPAKEKSMPDSYIIYYGYTVAVPVAVMTALGLRNGGLAANDPPKDR